MSEKDCARNLERNPRAGPKPPTPALLETEPPPEQPNKSLYSTQPEPATGQHGIAALGLATGGPQAATAICK